MAFSRRDAHACMPCLPPMFLTSRLVSRLIFSRQAEAFLAQKGGEGSGIGRDLAALHALGSHPLTLDLAIEVAGDLDGARRNTEKEHQPQGAHGNNVPSAWEVCVRERQEMNPFRNRVPKCALKTTTLSRPPPNKW